MIFAQNAGPRNWNLGGTVNIGKDQGAVRKERQTGGLEMQKQAETLGMDTKIYFSFWLEAE